MISRSPSRSITDCAVSLASSTLAICCPKLPMLPEVSMTRMMAMDGSARRWRTSIDTGSASSSGVRAYPATPKLRGPPTTTSPPPSAPTKSRRAPCCGAERLGAATSSSTTAATVRYSAGDAPDDRRTAHGDERGGDVVRGRHVRRCSNLRGVAEETLALRDTADADHGPSRRERDRATRDLGVVLRDPELYAGLGG